LADLNGILNCANSNLAPLANPHFTGNVSTVGTVGIGTTSPGAKLEVVGDTIVDGWLRTTGTAGWYSNTYGSGWYMADPTWVRSYGNNPVYMQGGSDTGSPSGIGCGGALGGGYTLHVCGSVETNGTIYANGADYISHCYMYYADGYYGGSGCWANNDSIVAANAVIGVEFDATSDMRKKTDIVNIPEIDGIRFVKKVEPVRFHWKTDQKGMHLTNGYLAQQLIAAGYEQMVSVSPAQENNLHEQVDLIEGVPVKSQEGHSYVANYISAIPLIHSAVRSLLEQVEALKVTVDSDHAEIAKLKADDDNLRSANDKEGKAIEALKLANDNLLVRIEALEAQRQPSGVKQN
jgi:hypothetical protein